MQSLSNLGLATAYTLILISPTSGFAQFSTDLTSSAYAGILLTAQQTSVDGAAQSSADVASQLNLESILQMSTLTSRHRLGARIENTFSDMWRPQEQLVGLNFNSQIGFPRASYELNLGATDRFIADVNSSQEFQFLIPSGVALFQQREYSIRNQLILDLDPVYQAGAAVQLRRRLGSEAGRDLGLRIFLRNDWSAVTDVEVASSVDFVQNERDLLFSQVDMTVRRQVHRNTSVQMRLGLGRIFDLMEDTSRALLVAGTVARWQMRDLQNEVALTYGVSQLEVTGTLAQTQEIRGRARYVGLFDHSFSFESAARQDQAVFTTSEEVNTRFDVVLNHEWAFGQAVQGPREDRPVALQSSVATVWNVSGVTRQSVFIRSGIILFF